MSRVGTLKDTLFIGNRKGTDLYKRIFVVSAFSGITNLLLEHKKSGTPGVYARFANSDNDQGWQTALDTVAAAMKDAHGAVLDHPDDLAAADDFVTDRIAGARSCLLDLQNLCSYGHFRLSDHMLVVRELLSGLGEAHSAFVTTQLLRRSGINARFVDLSGWREEAEYTLQERIAAGLGDVDLSCELPIVTGYAAILGSKFYGTTTTDGTGTVGATEIANRLLDTARTDTLINYTPQVYGRGEASIWRALAPDSIN